MLTDRLVKVFLGTIAVLLVTLVVQLAFRSPSEAQAAIEFPDSTKVYDVRLVNEFMIPDIREVVPLAADGERGVNFVVQTKRGVVVFRCDYFQK
ncbi:hypothetical protein JW916_02535 [Candidatus Sumerlaeota bacterium]|nr:hypothetical protein [Candidatus Sumerlaeota bacterium]